jgi:hypothetical protein
MGRRGLALAAWSLAVALAVVLELAERAASRAA